MRSPERGSFYDRLGVSHVASSAEIRAAFLRLAQRYHPDLNADDETADRRFKQIRRVYEILNDPLKRAAYDEDPSRFRLDDADVISDDLGPIVTRPVRSGAGDGHWSSTRGSMSASLFRPRWLNDSRFRRENRYVFAAVIIAMIILALIPMLLTEQRRQAIQSYEPAPYTEPVESMTVAITDPLGLQPLDSTALKQVMESVGELREGEDEAMANAPAPSEEEDAPKEVSRPPLDSMLDDWPTAFTSQRFPPVARSYPPPARLPGLRGPSPRAGSLSISEHVSRLSKFDSRPRQGVPDPPAVPNHVNPSPAANHREAPNVHSQHRFFSTPHPSFTGQQPTSSATSSVTSHVPPRSVPPVFAPPHSARSDSTAINPSSPYQTAPFASAVISSILHPRAEAEPSRTPINPAGNYASGASRPLTSQAPSTFEHSGPQQPHAEFAAPYGLPQLRSAVDFRLGQPAQRPSNAASYPSAPSPFIVPHAAQHSPGYRGPFNRDSTLGLPTNAFFPRSNFSPTTPPPRF